MLPELTLDRAKHISTAQTETAQGSDIIRGLTVAIVLSAGFWAVLAAVISLV